MKKIIGISATIMALTLLSVSVLGQLAVPASVTVPGSCGLIATSGSPITFGSVATGASSSNQTVAVKNTGSKATTGFTVYGTQWSNGGTTMLVGQTSVSDIGLWNAMPAVASPLTLFTGVIGNGATVSPQFKVAVPEGQAQGSYSQTVTFTAAC